MDGIEIPRYFLCPISLEIMKDPVIVSTGITYDRESIEKWLFSGDKYTCPVSKQPLPDSELTPNHTLRRLIQAWCTANASNGIERIPTPKAPVNKTEVVKLLQDVHGPRELQIKSFQKLRALITESERNKRVVEESGASKAMVSVINSCWKSEAKTNQAQLLSTPFDEALTVLQLIRTPVEELKVLVTGDDVFVESLTWVLIHGNNISRFHSLLILKDLVQVMEPTQLKSLNSDLFKGLVQILRERVSHQAIKASLQVLMAILPCGRSRNILVDLGAVFELIELLLDATERRICELTLGSLNLICECADGRSKFLEHAVGLAVVSKKIMRVSSSGDNWAVGILSSICKFSATRDVLQEMLRVGAVSKLCMVLQAQCYVVTKEKARKVLRLHSSVWKNSTCVAFYLLSRYP